MGKPGDTFETGEDITGRTVTGPEATAEDVERTETEEGLEDAAAAREQTGEKPGAEAGEETKPPKQRWEDLDEWARREIQDGRTAGRRFKAVGEQLQAMGFTVDEETGQVIPPETSTTTTTRRAEDQILESGLPAERKDALLGKLRMARLSDDPDTALLDVVMEVSTEMADRASRAAVGTVLSTTEESVVDSFKARFRNDPETGDIFKLAEREFDSVVATTKQEYQKLRIPFVPNAQLMGYLRSMALGQAMPRIRQALSGNNPLRRETAERVAGQTRLAPGTTTAQGEQPAALSAKDREVIRKMARGAGVDEAALTKRLTRPGGA